MPTLKFFYKYKFGKEYYYPLCEQGNLFLQLAKRSGALTPDDIKLLKKLGYTIKKEKEQHEKTHVE